MPTVSVVVATYRRDTVLKRALESLAAQTYRDFEIILVDDNDESAWNRKVEELVDGFRNTYPAIDLNYIQNHPNLGSAKARNAGIEASVGEYVCFLDDDDIYHDGRIEHQLIRMREENADYGVTDLALYSESEKLIEIRTREYIKETTRDMLLNYHLMYHITGTDTMMFRREYLVKIGCFSPIDVGDEFYLMQKAIEGGGKFLYCPVCDVKAYVHTGEGGLSSGQKKIEGENTLFEHKRQFFAKLDKKAVRYIKCRHYAVLAYAYLRQKKMTRFVTSGVRAFFASPANCISILKNR